MFSIYPLVRRRNTEETRRAMVQQLFTPQPFPPPPPDREITWAEIINRGNGQYPEIHFRAAEQRQDANVHFKFIKDETRKGGFYYALAYARQPLQPNVIIEI